MEFSISSITHQFPFLPPRDCSTRVWDVDSPGKIIPHFSAILSFLSFFGSSRFSSQFLISPPPPLNKENPPTTPRKGEMILVLCVDMRGFNVGD